MSSSTTGDQAPDNKINFELIKSEPGHREYKIWVAADPVIEVAEERIKKESAELEMAGFRKGAVPPKIARKHIGEKILSNVIDKRIAQMLQYVIEAQSLVIDRPPDINVDEFEQNKDLSITVGFGIIENIPEIDYKHPELQGKIKVLKLRVTDEDVEKSMAAVREMSISFNSVTEDYQAVLGDKLLIDFEGKVDDQPFDGGSGSNIELVLGSESFIEGFESQLVGVKAGESRTVTAVFPKNYHVSSLVGKEGVFKVIVHSISVPEKQEFNEEFLNRMGLESFDELKEMIADRIRSDFSVLSRLLVKKQLFDVIDRIVEMDVPAKMIEVDFKSLWADVLPKIPQTGGKERSQDEMALKVMDVARRRVKLGLLLADIAKRHAVTVTEEDIQEAKVMEIEKRLQDQEEIEKFYSDRRNYAKIEGAVLEEKVISMLINDFIEVVEEEITTAEFNEVYAPQLQDVV